MIALEAIHKRFADLEVLRGVSVQVPERSVTALIGPSGSGKSTLLRCVNLLEIPQSGSVTVGGHDVVKNFRASRELIGLVPQEISLEPFEKVFNAVSFSRGLFGKAPDPAYVERVLRQLSLWDKRDSAIMPLSGGMKRRVLIAKALAHQPKVLFLDEPSAGVDVELRKDMWSVVGDLKAAGVTIILTTHYIEEAEAIADRVGVINKGEILLVEDKAALMRRMGQKQLHVELAVPLTALPAALAHYPLELGSDRQSLIYTYDTKGERTGIVTFLSDLRAAGLQMTDLQTRQSSLEDIFVGLLREQA
ncbi:MAG: ABC transporter ATP-binding protein [Hyphomicrobiales bacterium]|nr:MAG: ABC transporter ATP-binding protein [Hyphomicrobiales bacterium]